MTVCDLWRALPPGVEIEVYSSGIVIANDLPYYFNNDLLNLKIKYIKDIKRNKLLFEKVIIEVY